MDSIDTNGKNRWVDWRDKGNKNDANEYIVNTDKDTSDNI